MLLIAIVSAQKQKAHTFRVHSRGPTKQIQKEASSHTVSSIPDRLEEGEGQTCDVGRGLANAGAAASHDSRLHGWGGG